MQFRKDINGLRAIAVILVMLFHYNDSWVPGGFAGVDIFLVISGFLITNILINKNNGLIDFYIKRVKRILPNTYVIILVTLLIGYFVSLPNDYRTDGLSSLFSVFYLANIRFAFLDDYFNPSHISPLLHLWSLSLEEQFYIIFPFLILLIKDHKKRIFTITALLVCSLIFMFGLEKQQAYYLLPSRMFGLLVGALLAILKYKGIKLKYFSMFIFLFFFFILFLELEPSVVSVMASILSALVISTNGSYIHSILSSKVLGKIGELSFSLYLWHWPIIAFFMILELPYKDNILYLLFYLTLSFSLSLLTKYYIEDVFRYKIISVKNVILFYLVLPMVFISSISLYIFKCNGLPERFNLTKDLTRTMNVEIFDKVNTYDKNGPAIIYKADNDKGSILLIGDSHSGHFVDFFKEVSMKLNSNYSVYYAPAGVSYYSSDRLYEDIRSYGTKATIFSTRMDNRDDEILVAQSNYLKELVITGKDVYLIHQVPKLNGDVFIDENLIKNYINGKLPMFTSNIDYNYNKRNKLFDGIGLNVLDFSMFFIEEQKIKVQVNNKPIYMDDDHINSFGSKWLADECIKSEICLDAIVKVFN